MYIRLVRAHFSKGDTHIIRTSFIANFWNASDSTMKRMGVHEFVSDVKESVRIVSTFRPQLSVSLT